MTLFYHSKRGKASPQLHALIIGVDHYPYLGPTAAIARKLPPLDNLHSPSTSARMLAEWLVDHKSWLKDVELGSVDLVVASVPASTTARRRRSAPTASLEAVMTAFDAWFDRCDANPDNVAFFYFCGHGLQKDDMLLLPEDFGSHKNAPWAHAINFDATYRGMSNCAARTQYFIIDACRQWTQSLLQDLNTGGVALGRADIRKQKPRTAPKLYGTASGLAAFGDIAGGPSRLTRAVIACMEGKAAVKENGRWRITVERLGAAAQSLVNLGNRTLPERERQVVDPVIGEFAAGNRTLLVLPDGVHPHALVEFDCDPNEATEHASFYHQGISPLGPECGAGCRGPWSVELLAGIYDCGVRIDHPQFVSTRLSNEVIFPPVRSVNVSVARGSLKSER